MIGIAIVGGAGRMGQVMAQGLGSLDEFSVVALVDRVAGPQREDAAWFTSLEQVDASTIDAVVDFSTPEGVVASARWCAQHATALVVGATGLSGADRAALDAAAERTAIVVASNFSIGAVLAERFAAMAAPYFERVEVIELHHDAKVDAPSGTSITTARAIARARERAGRSTAPDPTHRHTVEGARGASVDGVLVHAVRLPGLVAHQEVLFGSPGEGLTIRHDSYDRLSFVGGVAAVLRHLPSGPGLIEGLDRFIEGV